MEWFDSAFAQTLVGALAGIVGVGLGAWYTSRQAADLARDERAAAARQMHEDRLTTHSVAALDRLHGDRTQLVHELRAPSATCLDVYVAGTQQLRIMKEAKDDAEVMAAAQAFHDKYASARGQIDHGLAASSSELIGMPVR